MGEVRTFISREGSLRRANLSWNQQPYLENKKKELCLRQRSFRGCD